MSIADHLRNKACCTCGSRLGVVQPLIRAPGMPTQYEGVICLSCCKTECVRCKGRVIQAPCSSCGGKVDPIWEHSFAGALAALANGGLNGGSSYQLEREQRANQEQREREQQQKKEREERERRLKKAGATLSFTPSADVVDIDGNRYRTVKIGNQIWMAENLKVTKYNDGTAIHQGREEYEEEEEYVVRRILGIFPVKQTRMMKKTRNVDWKSLGERKDGAVCHYENKPENGGKYGALYNWHAVNTGKLAPAGWHVPTDSEWEELGNFCGGRDIAGKFLKTDNGWDGNNKSGFGALPAGDRTNFGDFTLVGSLADFWSSSENDADNAWYRALVSGNDGLNRHNGGVKKRGYSVRCLKD